MGLTGQCATLLRDAADYLGVEKRLNALAQVESFRSSAHASAWPRLDRALVADRLAELVMHPSLVEQDHLSACAPATFLRCWIPRDPVAFVAFATTLYENGSATIGPVSVTPNTTLRNQDFAALAPRLTSNLGGICKAAEWMVMSALLDSTAIAGFDGVPSTSQLLSPNKDDMVTWLKATNLYSSVTFLSKSFFTSSPGLRELRPSARRDIVLLVNGLVLQRLLDPQWAGLGPWYSTIFSNHMIRLLTPPSAVAGQNGTEYTLDLWSWGRDWTITCTTDQLDELDRGKFIAELN